MAKNNFEQTEENLANIEEAISRTEQFVENNKKNLSYGVLAIFAIVLLVMGYNKYFRIPAEATAYNTIWHAEQYFNQNNFDLALNGNDEEAGFLDIINEHGSTKSGNLAQYYAGICYFNMAQNDTSDLAEEYYQEAISHLKKFSSDDLSVMPMAIGVIGDCHMELGDSEKAASQYMKAASFGENNLLNPMFLKKAGLTYSILEKHDKALEAFNTIKINYANSEEGNEIKKYIAREEEYLK